jgi:hypothetical protein
MSKRYIDGQMTEVADTNTAAVVDALHGTSRLQQAQQRIAAQLDSLAEQVAEREYQVRESGLAPDLVITKLIEASAAVHAAAEAMRP